MVTAISHRGQMMRRLSLCFLTLLTLSGCFFEDKEEGYLFGPAKRCFESTLEWNSSSLDSCSAVEAYDRIQILASKSRQEVAISIAELALDTNNVKFITLKECTVIDAENYSCPGLVRSSGTFTDTKAFGAKRYSPSFFAYAWSHYGKKTLSKGALEFLSDYDTPLTVVASILALVALIGILGDT